MIYPSDLGVLGVEILEFQHQPKLQHPSPQKCYIAVQLHQDMLGFRICASIKISCVVRFSRSFEGLDLCSLPLGKYILVGSSLCFFVGSATLLDRQVVGLLGTLFVDSIESGHHFPLQIRQDSRLEIC